MAPSKQLPMNAIMMYMSGNSLQIFSIMMVFMLFKGPIQGLINTNTVFAKFDTEGTHKKLLGVKAVYVLVQFGLLALGVWKVNAMGLLPYVLFALVLCGCVTDGGQDYEVGLVGLGVGTATAGTGLFCVWLNSVNTMYHMLRKMLHVARFMAEWIMFSRDSSMPWQPSHTRSKIPGKTPKPPHTYCTKEPAQHG